MQAPRVVVQVVVRAAAAATTNATVQGDHGGVDRVVLHPRVAELQRLVFGEVGIAAAANATVDLEPQKHQEVCLCFLTYVAVICPIADKPVAGC